jgi:hypothetical protein
MRQYRGLTKDDEWIYGWYVKSKTGRCFIVGEENLDFFEHDEYGRLIKPYEFDGFIEVIPETVGQQIGKIDIKDKEIYHSDIVRFTYDCLFETHILTGIIEYNSDGYWMIDVPMEGISFSIFDKRIHEIEIIGNVPQNKDLIK